jgi:3-isopropylmalate/(R)-2-methylmalate dehydratase large subunit
VGADWEAAEAAWRDLHSDDGAAFDREVVLAAADVVPQVTWGTSPEMVAPVTGSVPQPNAIDSGTRREATQRALDYMGLTGGMPITAIPVDRVFHRLVHELAHRGSARGGGGRARPPGGRTTVKQAMVVPGSGEVKAQAEAEGLHRIFLDAGMEWREPGCSMCLAMNADKLGRGEHCASTSNRNFEGRQGFGGRTHLVSPAMAAAAAVAGHFVDVRSLTGEREVDAGQQQQATGEQGHETLYMCTRAWWRRWIAPTWTRT